MPTFTPNFNLSKPLVNNATDQDLWGGFLNDDMDTIDTELYIAQKFATLAKTANYTVTTADEKKLILCDATTASFIVTLPTAASAGNGFQMAVKKTDVTVNTVTVDGSGSETIDGSTTLVLSSQNDSIDIVCDGSNWFTVSREPTIIPDASETVKGLIEIATVAETLAGTDLLRAITPASIASGSSIISNGYYKLPGGLMIQWGGSASGAAVRTISFHTAFPTACFVVLANATLNARDVGITNFNSTTFSISQSNSGTPIYWIAIGA